MTQFYDTRLPFIIFNTTSSGKISHQARDVKYLPQREKRKKENFVFPRKFEVKSLQRGIDLEKLWKL